VLDHDLLGSPAYPAGIFRIAAFVDGFSGGEIPHVAVGQPDDERASGLWDFP